MFPKHWVFATAPWAGIMGTNSNNFTVSAGPAKLLLIFRIFYFSPSTVSLLVRSTFKSHIEEYKPWKEKIKQREAEAR